MFISVCAVADCLTCDGDVTQCEACKLGLGLVSATECTGNLHTRTQLTSTSTPTLEHPQPPLHIHKTTQH